MNFDSIFFLTGMLNYCGAKGKGLLVKSKLVQTFFFSYIFFFLSFPSRFFRNFLLA